MMATALTTLKKINISKLSPLQLRDWVLSILIPTLGLLGFLVLWQVGSQHIDTSLGTFPGPKEVAAQWSNLVDEYTAEKIREQYFYDRQDERHAGMATADYSGGECDLRFGQSDVFQIFYYSMFAITLCSLWPTMINTAVGVGSVSKDFINVSRVLHLSWFTHVRKIVLPSAIPMIFTGLRLSLGTAWMVLIAAEMLAAALVNDLSKR